MNRSRQCFGAVLICASVAAIGSAAVTQRWTPPQPGWIYVLDVGEPGGNGGVFLVDPTAGTIKGYLPTGYHPEAGLCDDGTALYTISGPQSTGVLSAIDTKTGTARARIDIPDRAIYTVRPATPGIACSRDNRWLFTQQMIPVNPGVDENRLAIVNVQDDTLSAQTLPLPEHCGIARLVSWPFGTWDIAAQCSATNSLRLAMVTSAGGVQRIQDVGLNLAKQWAVHRPGFPATGQRSTIATVVEPSNRMLVIFRGGGGIDEVDPETLIVQQESTDAWQRWSPPGSVAISKSGMAFVGSMAYSERANSEGLMSTIAIENTSNWTEVASMRTTVPFSGLVLSGDGQSLYAVSPKAQSVTVIDTATLHEVRTIRGLGEAPSLILVQK